MATFDLTVMEDLLLTWLESDPDGRVSPPMHSYLKTIDSYAGQFVETALPRLPMLTPAAFVIYGGGPGRFLDNIESEIGRAHV